MIKIFLSIIGFFLVIVIALFFLVIFLNLSDEPLKPEVKKALAWQLPEQALDNNGYLILLGMDAPTDQDAYQVGKKKLKAELSRYQTTQKTQKSRRPPANLKTTSLLTICKTIFVIIKKYKIVSIFI